MSPGLKSPSRLTKRLARNSPNQQSDNTSNYIRDGRSPIPENEAVSRVMSSNRAKDTKPELLLRKALWNVGLRGYRLHWKKAPGRPDIAFPGRKVAIFVNGCFWHRCPHCNLPLPKTNTGFWKEKFGRNVQRDTLKVEHLENDGWHVLTVWECKVKDDMTNVLKSIRRIVLPR